MKNEEEKHEEENAHPEIDALKLSYLRAQGIN